jgi:transcriptional regulator with XRE-family HTH domain
MGLQDFGRRLRQTREARELSLEDAEQALRIRKRILESFELGEFEHPSLSVVQINGFIRNYARWLGLEEDETLEQFEAAKIDDSRRSRRRPAKDKTLPKRSTQELRAVNGGRTITDTHPTLPPVKVKVAPPPVPVAPPGANLRPQRGAGVLTLLLRLVVAVAALAIIAFVGVQIWQSTPTGIVDTGDDNPFAQGPTVPTFTLAPTATRVLPTSTAQSIRQTFGGQGVLVTLTMRQRTWLLVTVDQAQRFVGIARPGEILEYSGISNITVRASNAEALDVIYNGQQQQPFGARGQQVDVTFTTTGLQISAGQEPEIAAPAATAGNEVGTLIAQQTPSPTPGPSPTPTETLPPTETPLPSSTPSVTPLPSATPTASATPPPTATAGPSPTATAILPPRAAAASPTPTKSG